MTQSRCRWLGQGPVSLWACIQVIFSGRIVSRCVLGFLLLSFLPGSLKSQNLVPDSSFEQIWECPVDWFASNTLLLWNSYSTYGIPANFHSCSLPWTWGIPVNMLGNQPAHSGEGYVGLILYSSFGANIRHYWQAALAEPLEAGQCYEVSGWISLCDGAGYWPMCGSDRIGFLFSSNPEPNLLGHQPQVDIQVEYFSDSLNWTYVSGSFIATGEESFISIGNFHLDAQTTHDPSCFGDAYYYFDDISVVAQPEVMEEMLDLGPPVTACLSYLIDPEVDASTYEWSDGSDGPTLTVTTSGTYSVTAYAGCTTYTGSVNVTILEGVQVELEPGTIELCEGESYTLSLDPALGTYTWQDGSTGPVYTITSGGTYSVTLDDGCQETSDALQVLSLAPPPPVDLGEDIYFCDGVSFDLALDPAMGEFLWQDGSTQATYTITYGGVYSVTVSNECGDVTDTLQAFGIQPPELILPGDSLVLCDGATESWHLDPTQGDYNWSNGTLGPDIILEAAGPYHVTVTNACGQATGAFFVQVMESPDPDLGADGILCPGDSLTLVTSGMPGQYIWQDGSTGISYPVKAPGTYAVTITNTCGSAADTIVISAPDSLSIPDLGPNMALCPGETLWLSVDGTDAQVVWNDQSTSDSLAIDTAGLYWVLVSNLCFSYADTILVTVSDEPPSVDLPAGFALCAGDTVILDAAISGVEFQWSDGSTDPQLSVTAPGTYAVTVSNACGSSADSTVVLAGILAPAISLGPDTMMCPGEILVIEPVSSGAVNWLWQDGSTGPVWTASDGGQVVVTVSNDCGQASDTMQVTLLPALPAFSLGPDTAICPGESLVLSVGLSNVDIAWQDGSGDTSIIVTDAGLYHATVSSNCGSRADTIRVGLLPAAPSIDLGPDGTICPGDTVIVESPAGLDADLQWQDGSTGPGFAATQGGWIVLTAANECGIATDSLYLFETTEGPLADLGPDRAACEGDTVWLSAGIGGVTYRWQDGSSGIRYPVTSTGEYSLTVSNACGMDSDTVMVEISGEAPLPDLGADTILCEGAVLTLTVTPVAGALFSWQDGSTMATYTVTGPGLYTVLASNQCGVGLDSILVSYIAGPAPFDLGPDTVLCPGQSVWLHAPDTTNLIRWQDGSTGTSFLADREGVYELRIFNRCGEVRDDLEVFVMTDEPVLDLGPDIVLCPGEALRLDATQAFPADYRWNTGETTSSIHVTAVGIYAVEVGTPCFVAADQVEVTEGQDCDGSVSVYIPNVFSPNGDGVNDLFDVHVRGSERVLRMEGGIYDRWGGLVYRSDANPFSWDGRCDGAILNPGVYVYRIDILIDRGTGAQVERFSGSVTLLR